MKPTTRYRWAVVGMLWFICFFNYADRQAISVVLPVLKDKYGFSSSQLGMIGAAFMWVYAATAPLAGQVGDKFSRKAVILGGLTIWSVITGFTAACSKVWHFVLVRGSEGLGETFYFPASMSLISDYHAKDTRSRAMSLHQTSVYAGTIGGSVFAGYLAQKYNWQMPFILFGGLGVLLAGVLWFFLREPARNEAERNAGVEEFVEAEQISWWRFIRELTRTPSAMLLLLAFMGTNSVAGVFLTWTPTFLKEKFGLNLASAGFNATVFIQLASMVGAPLGGLLADALRKRYPGGRMMVQGIGTLLGTPFIFACGYLRDLHILQISMVLFGLCKGIHDSNIVAGMYDVVPPARRGSAVGMLNFIGWIGAGFCTWLIGYVTDKGIPMSVSISAMALIYIIVATLFFVSAFVFAPRDVRR